MTPAALDDLAHHLAAHGFELARTERWLVAQFPDGHDGLMFALDAAPTMTAARCVELAESRRRALNALFHAFADQGWGMRPDEGGRARVEYYILELGRPLTFHLERSDWATVVVGILEELSIDVPVERVRSTGEEDGRARSEACLETKQRTEARGVELSATPPLSEAALAVLAEARDAKQAARDARWERAHPDKDLSARLEGAIAVARHAFEEGEALWMATTPPWFDDDDDWIPRADWLRWAAPESTWIYDGALILLRWAREEYRERLGQYLRDALQAGEHELEYLDDAYCAHFLSEPRAVARVMSLVNTFPRAALCRAGDDHSRFAVWRELQDVVRRCASEPVQACINLCDLAERYHELLTALLDDQARRALTAAAVCTLTTPDPDADEHRTAYVSAALASVAFVLRDRALAERLLADDRWRAALLTRTFRQFLALKEGILHLSLVAPGPACLRLIDEACDHFASAINEQGIDTTALALAVAWRRCQRAMQPGAASSQPARQ